MARGRPEVPKHMQKKVARQLLERQKRADTYEKGLEGLGKGFLAGSAYPADVAEMMAKGALTAPASYKGASMRPVTSADLKLDPESGKLVRKTPPPVQDPKLKGTYPYFAKKMGIEPDSAESIAGSFFSLDPLAKAHAVAMGTKWFLAKFGGLGIGAAMFGGLKKVGKAEDVAKPIFTSPGKTAAADIAKETIPANKVRSQLEGRGVNKDELEWTGFNEWIKTKKGEVSKVELEEFFQQNQIEVREVVRGGKRDAYDDAQAIEELAREQTGDELYALMSNDEGLYKNRNTIEPLIQRYREGDGNAKQQLDEWYASWGYDDEPYIDTYFERVKGDLESTYVRPDEVKFGSPQWQLPGGENYRELVLMVPPKKVPWTKENVVPISAEEYVKTQGYGKQTPQYKEFTERGDSYWLYKTPDGVERMPKNIQIHNHKITQEEALEKILTRERPDPKPRYTGGHFEENDVVAHIRFNERVDPDGNKVLFIEEIQGDWAHKGQSMGFKSPKHDEIKALIKEKDVIVERAESGMSESGGTYLKILEKDQARYDEISKILDETPSGLFPANAVERGPFVTDTHQWTNLALKRMIRWGSDNGFDSIGWVTGKQSADRYKVSTQVDTIYWNPKTTELVAVEKGGNRKVINEKVPENKLADYIGKEPANRLLESQLGEGEKILQQYDDGLITYDELDFMTDSHSLQGEDLDIGGEYHKLIYDQVLTAQAKKIGKKHGAKVEEGSVIASDPAQMRKAYQENYANDYEIADINDYPEVFEDEIASRIPGARSTVIVDPNGEFLSNPLSGDITFFDNVAHAQDQLNFNASQAAEDLPERFLLEMYEDADEAAEKVWSMRLTDKLKQASKDGMPYYVALPPLVMGAAAQRSDAQRQQSKSDAQAILTQ